MPEKKPLKQNPFITEAYKATVFQTVAMLRTVGQLYFNAAADAERVITSEYTYTDDAEAERTLASAVATLEIASGIFRQMDDLHDLTWTLGFKQYCRATDEKYDEGLHERIDKIAAAGKSIASQEALAYLRLKQRTKAELALIEAEKELNDELNAIQSV